MKDAWVRLRNRMITATNSQRISALFGNVIAFAGFLDSLFAGNVIWTCLWGALLLVASAANIALFVLRHRARFEPPTRLDLDG